MIFHAKEYPADLELMKNRYQIAQEKFSTGTKVFYKRNFIYMSHLCEGKNIYLVSKKSKCESLFSLDGANQLAEENIMGLLP